ncbi:unnamed protein product [Hanseniaspora opuntiae]
MELLTPSKLHDEKRTNTRNLTKKRREETDCELSQKKNKKRKLNSAISQDDFLRIDDISPKAADTNSVGPSAVKKLLNQLSRESNDESTISVQASQKLISTGDCENLDAVNASLHVASTPAPVEIDLSTLESDQQVEIMSDSVEDSTLSTPKYDVMNAETVREEHTTKNNFLASRIKNKLRSKTTKPISFVQIYTNKDQDIKIYAAVKNEPVMNKESIDDDIHKLKITDLSSYDKKKFGFMASNEVKKISFALRNLERGGKLIYNTKAEVFKPVASGDYYLLFKSTTMITLCYIDVPKVVESRSIVQLSNYLDCIKNNREPLAVILSKAKRLTDEEEHFKNLGYNLNYNEARKNVGSNHLALYRELNCRFQKLVATICLPNYNNNDFSVSSASKILMRTNESWNKRFVSRTIWSVHYHAVVESRRRIPGNLQPIIEYDDHMLTLSKYGRERTESESVKKAIVTAETDQQQLPSTSKTERIKRTLRRFNRNDYQPVKLHSEDGLIRICRDHLNRSSSGIEENNNKNDCLKSVNKELIQLKEELSQSEDKIIQLKEKLSQSEDKLSRSEDKLSQSEKQLQECKHLIKEMGQLNQELKNSSIDTDRNFMKKYGTLLAYVTKVPLDPVSRSDLIQLITALL